MFNNLIFQFFGYFLSSLIFHFNLIVIGPQTLFVLSSLPPSFVHYIIFFQLKASFVKLYSLANLYHEARKYLMLSLYCSLLLHIVAMERRLIKHLVFWLLSKLLFPKFKSGRKETIELASFRRRKGVW